MTFSRRWKSQQKAGDIESLAGGNGGNDKKQCKTQEGDDSGGFLGLSAMWAAYLKLLEKSPLFTKAWTCALLNGLGDFICQQFIESGTGFDLRRFITFAFLGAVLVAPGLHYWYTLLNQMISKPGLLPGVYRMILDQFLWAPLFVGLFITTLMTINTLPQFIKYEEIQAKLHQDWFDTVKLNWTLWVPAQTLNFWLVPPNLQVLVANITAIIWNVILSYFANRKVIANEQQ